VVKEKVQRNGPEINIISIRLRLTAELLPRDKAQATIVEIRAQIVFKNSR